MFQAQYRINRIGQDSEHCYFEICFRIFNIVTKKKKKHLVFIFSEKRTKMISGAVVINLVSFKF